MGANNTEKIQVWSMPNIRMNRVFPSNYAQTFFANDLSPLQKAKSCSTNTNQRIYKVQLISLCGDNYELIMNNRCSQFIIAE